ncbi:MAG TPA: HAD family hydrolase [Pseudonocardiaceae bacterium]|nr:HAD family hydrolase [Pseudonocardiaceae bacterium]
MASPTSLLAEREHVLLTFDGPVCSVYAGVGERVVADRLRAYLGPHLPETVATTADPFEVLAWARTLSATAGRLVELELRKQELAAMATAVQTPGVLDLVRDLALRGHTVTVVSNHSMDAVGAYLAGREIGRYVYEISARHSEEPTPLMPDPYLLTQAVLLLDTTPDRACLVAGSVMDVQAASAAGLPAIEYAPHSAALVGTMSEV